LGKGKLEMPLGIAIATACYGFELMGAGRATKRKQDKRENQISERGL
jgi:hypothetical protein